jgi:hypothetical protein
MKWGFAVLWKRESLYASRQQEIYWASRHEWRTLVYFYVFISTANNLASVPTRGTHIRLVEVRKIRRCRSGPTDFGRILFRSLSSCVSSALVVQIQSELLYTSQPNVER